MNLSSPITCVIPSAHGPVLAALVRAGAPLSGRQIAGLVEGQVGRSRVNSILGELTKCGLVLRESHPPSSLYRLNRDHVAAESVEALASLRQLLLERMRGEVSRWKQPAAAAWVFGSAARGDGSSDSDIDVLVVRPDGLDEEDPGWREQLSVLADHVQAWSGNACELLELSRSEVDGLFGDGQRLAADLRRDAIVLAGDRPSAIVRRPWAAAKS